MKTAILAVVAVCLMFTAAGQEKLSSTSKGQRDFSFANYLIMRGDIADAQYYLHNIRKAKLRLGQNTDSLDYLLGWSHYFVKNLDSSEFYLKQVSPASDFFLKSRFYAAYNATYLGRYQDAKELLSLATIKQADSQSADNQIYNELFHFQRAGLALLERDYAEFETQRSNFSYAYYPFSAEEENMATYSSDLRNFRPRSGWMAGLLSAVIPGTGKIYAGKAGEGIAALLVVGSLGLVSWENYHKDGLADAKTLFFGSLASVYYLGNIWGSVFAARRHNQQLKYEMENRILFDLHIPLRNIFNE